LEGFAFGKFLYVTFFACPKKVTKEKAPLTQLLRMRSGGPLHNNQNYWLLDAL
jgi:hypothetical protein